MRAPTELEKMDRRFDDDVRFVCGFQPTCDARMNKLFEEARQRIINFDRQRYKQLILEKEFGKSLAPAARHSLDPATDRRANKL